MHAGSRSAQRWSSLTSQGIPLPLLQQCSQLWWASQQLAPTAAPTDQTSESQHAKVMSGIQSAHRMCACGLASHPNADTKALSRRPGPPTFGMTGVTGLGLVFDFLAASAAAAAALAAASSASKRACSCIGQLRRLAVYPAAKTMLLHTATYQTNDVLDIAVPNMRKHDDMVMCLLPLSNSGCTSP